MDAFLDGLRLAVAYATIASLGLMTAITIWMSQHPDTSITMLSVTFVLMVYQYHKQMRRFIRVFLLWPPVRWYHRLIRKPIRYLAGGIMARWRRAIVADELDDTLARLCYEDHLITQEQYRHMSKIIGKSLGLTDLVPKKRNPISLRQRVLTNIAMLKDVSVAAVENRLRRLEKAKAPKAEGKLDFLKKRNAA